MNEVETNEPVEQEQQSAHVKLEQVRTPAEKDVKKIVEPAKKAKRPLFSTPWPWILFTAPLIGVCVWLASHPEIITDNINQPYALLAAPVLIGSIIAGLLIYKFFQSIITGCQSAWQAFQRARKEDGSAQFFWIVIIVFLLVSVCASGSFFQTLEKNALPGIGYITALFIDLVAVQAMRARLNAVRMRDKKGSRLYLAGVLLCSGASAFANVYTSLSDFQSVKTGALPDWMVSVAPWFGLVFPAMILLLSVTADYTLDQVSTKLDPEQYKEQEAKRTKLLEYQLEALQQRVQFEADIDRLAHRMKERREFFLIRWLFPKSAPSVIQVVDQVIEEMRRLYAPQLQLLTSQVQLVSEQNQWLRCELSTLATESKQAYGLLAWGVHQRIEAIDNQKDTDLYLLTEKISEAQNVTMEKVQTEINQTKDEVISLLQNRLNEEHKTIVSECVSECLSVVQTASFDDDEHPFSREDELSFDDDETDDLSDDQNDDQTDVETPANQEKKAKKTAVKTGYQIELDPVAQKLVANYPNVASWISRSAKSATLEEIKKVTGHTGQMVSKRVEDGTLKKTSRRPNAYTMKSIIEWLSTAPLPRAKNAEKEDTKQSVEVPQTPPVEMQINDHVNDTQTDEKVTDTGEHEVLSKSAIEEGLNALKDLDLCDYQSVPAVAS